MNVKIGCVNGMISKSKQTSEEFLEIKKKLSEVQNDLKRFIEQSNRQQLELILANSRKDLSNAIMGYVVRDAEDTLDGRMVKKCEMRDECRSKFNAFLKNNAGLIAQDSVEEERVRKNRSDLESLEASAPHKRCSICFSEVSGLFEKQVSLMKSMQIYNSDTPKVTSISEIPEEDVVSGILDPIANKTRLQILKALYYETRTFSALSDITGLRAGNLLFHLQKLLGCGMVIQRHEGGDYMITDKGYKILTTVNEMYEALNNGASGQ